MPWRALRWLLPVGLMWFAAWRSAPVRRLVQPGIREAMHPLIGRWMPGAPIRAALLVQLKDCQGNLRLIEPLHRGAVRERITLSAVWHTGPANDSTRLRALLPRWTEGTPVQPVPRGVLRDLARMGYQETPVLIVFDPEGHIRFVTRAPRTSREYAGLRQVIEGLTYIEEL